MWLTYVLINIYSAPIFIEYAPQTADSLPLNTYSAPMFIEYVLLNISFAPIKVDYMPLMHKTYL